MRTSLFPVLALVLVVWAVPACGQSCSRSVLEGGAGGLEGKQGVEVDTERLDNPFEETVPRNSDNVFVTLLYNDGYALPVFVLISSLQRTGTNNDIIVMITPSVTERVRQGLVELRLSFLGHLFFAPSLSLAIHPLPHLLTTNKQPLFSQAGGVPGGGAATGEPLADGQSVPDPLSPCAHQAAHLATHAVQEGRVSGC